ncbi:ATP synthase F1, delta subunit, partial [Mycoplasma putrefaciens]
MILTYTNNKQKKQSVKLIDETFSSFGFNLYIINTMKLLVEKRAFIHFRDILKILYKNLLATKKIASGIVW